MPPHTHRRVSPFEFTVPPSKFEVPCEVVELHAPHHWPSGFGVVIVSASGTRTTRPVYNLCLGQGELSDDEQ